MSPVLLGIVSAIYASVGIEQFFKGEIWWGIAWTCYAIANIALIQTMTK